MLIQVDNLKIKRNLEGCLWLFKHASPTSTIETTPTNPSNPSNSKDPKDPKDSKDLRDSKDSQATNMVQSTTHEGTHRAAKGDVANSNTASTTRYSLLPVSFSFSSFLSFLHFALFSSLLTGFFILFMFSSSSQRTKQLERWTVEDVKQWLNQAGLGQYHYHFFLFIYLFNSISFCSVFISISFILYFVYPEKRGEETKRK